MSLDRTLQLLAALASVAFGVALGSTLATNSGAETSYVVVAAAVGGLVGLLAFVPLVTFFSVFYGQLRGLLGMRRLDNRAAERAAARQALVLYVVVLGVAALSLVARLQG